TLVSIVNLWSQLMNGYSSNMNVILSRLKNILKIGGDVLMKDVQEIATMGEPKCCQEKTQCVAKDETDDMKMESDIKRNKKLF
uniref:Protein LLP homolog n=1 Tax=Sus scrofa TaxID=9823 RepID=A0A286ZJP8_PIG